MVEMMVEERLLREALIKSQEKLAGLWAGEAGRGAVAWVGCRGNKKE